MGEPTQIPVVSGSELSQVASAGGTNPSGQALEVAQPSVAASKMAEDWPMLGALLAGTKAMRAMPILLPMQDREGRREYDYRLKTATLYPAMIRTRNVMAGKPFSKQMTLGDDVPSTLAKLADNIDNQGRNAHAFFYDVMEELLGFGIGGVLVDTPRLILNPTGTATQADVRAQGIKPYFTLVRHDSILGWRSTVQEGVVKLTQLRLKEELEVEVGAYDTGFQPAVRVLRPGSWELWKLQPGTGSYALAPEDQGTTSLADIPFVPFYGRRKDFMVGESPLLDLAYLNVKHWQVQSDQDDSTRFCRKRLLVFIGVDETTLGKIEVSSDSAISLGDNPQADAKIIQGSAESVTVGREELADLEEQMVRTGAELLVMKPAGQRTATQDNNEAEANKSELQRIVENFEDGVDQCFQFAAEFIGEVEGGHVSLFKDFGAANLSDASADLVLKMQGSGLISKETAIKEQQRRGMLSPDIDPTAELASVDEEGPPPGMAGLDPITGLPMPDLVPTINNPLPSKTKPRQPFVK